MSLRIEVWNDQTDFYFIEYDSFLVGPQTDNFREHVGKKTNGTIGDCFYCKQGIDAYHDTMQFTTYDSDIDFKSDGNCATFADC